MSIKRAYHRQMYLPTALGIVINPFYIARRGLASAVKQKAGRLGGQLLDIGCGSKPYESLFHVARYIGLDIDSAESRRRAIADFYYDGIHFPFEDGAFDSALCNQVLEHVFNPDEFLREIHRVLKPGARVLLTMPFAWDEHEQPHDYARYSRFGLKALLEKNGFRIMEHEFLSADTGALFQLFNAYLFKVTVRWPRVLHLAMTVTAMALVNLLGVVFARILPANQDLYLDHVVVAEKQP